MPLFNEAYWQERAGTTGATWSGDRWLDWEHGIVCRSAFRRIWPAIADVFPTQEFIRVLDVGGGDGRFAAWIAETFSVEVLTMDGVYWPEGERLAKTGAIDGWMIGDAEQLERYGQVDEFAPDVVMFWNSLTCMDDWRKALTSATRLPSVRAILVFDNLQDPTPAYWVNLPHRIPVPNGQLDMNMRHRGWLPAKAVAGDVIHRRWLRVTPRWTHPLVAAASAVVDRLAPLVVPTTRARHSAWLFVRDRFTDRWTT